MFCCDPGLVSGVAVLNWTPSTGIELVSSLECSLPHVGEAAAYFLQHHRYAESEVVCERFTITVRTAEKSQAPWSLKVCGVLEWEIWRNWGLDGEDVVTYQAAADAKRLVPNPVLHQVGLWHRGGAGHANDAIRHGVYRYARHGVVDAWVGLD